MTITISNTFIYYWIFSIVFETLYAYIMFRKSLNQIKKKAEQYQLIMVMVNHFKQTASMQLLWKRIFNPITYLCGYIIFCFISPILVPFSLFSLLKKSVGYKSKLEKKADEQKRLMEEARLKREWWMKNEGIHGDKDIDLDFTDVKDVDFKDVDSNPTESDNPVQEK